MPHGNTATYNKRRSTLLYFLEGIWCLVACCWWSILRLLRCGRRQIRHAPTVNRNAVAFYCGHGFIPGERQSWDGNSLIGGIGGSEQCLIRLAREFAALGHPVTVYNACGVPSTIDGVRYERTWAFDPWASYDHVIIWRVPIVLIVQRLKCRSLSFWVHDGSWVLILEKLPRWASGVLFRCLSQCSNIVGPSKEVLLDQFSLAKGAGTLIPHGLPDYNMSAPAERCHGHLIWPVSVDRGLDLVLRRLPDLEEAFGEPMRLHVCHERRGYHNLTAFDQGAPGLELTGMLGPEALGRMYHRCNLFIFPSNIPEAFSLSTWECMANGVVPIVYGLGSLADLDQYGAIVVPPGDEEGLISAACDLLRNPTELEKRRKTMQAKIASLEITWRKSARRWEDVVFKQKTAERDEGLGMWDANIEGLRSRRRDVAKE